MDITEAAQIMGRKGGKIGGLSKSKRKVDAARLNGRKGGRKKGSKNKTKKG